MQGWCEGEYALHHFVLLVSILTVILLSFPTQTS